jgi:hypothetical protein
MKNLKITYHSQKHSSLEFQVRSIINLSTAIPNLEMCKNNLERELYKLYKDNPKLAEVDYRVEPIKDELGIIHKLEVYNIAVPTDPDRLVCEIELNLQLAQNL